jgi:murein DD-endopeptidase MepM/ murein hydrolase activator NlpD
MMLRTKNLLIVGSLLLTTLIGWNIYNYFCSTSSPSLSISGLDENGCYGGDVQCVVSGKDNYKIADVSVWLDGKPLINKFKINSRECEHPFTIPTKTISNGKHTLKVELCNATYNKGKNSLERSFSIDNLPLQAAFVRPENEYKVFQGRTLHLQMQTNKDVKDIKVRTLSNTYECFQEAKNSFVYETYIPIPCEETPNEYLLSVDITDRVGNTLTLDNKFQIVMYPFKKQTIKVDPEKLKIEKEASLPTSEMERLLEQLTKTSPREKLWQGAFVPPIDIKGISTDFGTVRTTQDRGRYIHKGVDVLNAPKSVVWASADGIVIAKNRYEISGNTMVVDHGWGIFSLFHHLDTFSDVNVGDKIRKGNPVGTIGKTGYANGYHLHWEMRVNNVPVDPMQWISTTF